MSISSRTRQVLAFRLDTPPGQTELRVQDELGRFRVWAGNVAAHRPNSSRRSLEYRLRDSSNLEKTVVSLLRDLQAALNAVKKIIAQGSAPLVTDGSVDENPEASNAASGDGGEYESDDSDFFELDDEEAPTETEILDRALDEVHEVVNCLMRFSMALRNPARHDQVRQGSASSAKHYEPYDIQHVRTKFPQAPDYLITRLGKAISRHRQYFKYREAHHEKLMEGLDGLEEVKGTEERPSTIATSLRQVIPMTTASLAGLSALDSDAESVYTATSYATTTSGQVTLRPPPWPEAAQDGEPFECPICYGFVVAQTERSWRQHVYEDLPPYVCLHDPCPTGDKTYTHRRDWLHHESSTHNKYWTCPFGCAENENIKTFAGFEAHLQQLHEHNYDPSTLQTLADACAQRREESGRQVCPLCQKQHQNPRLLQKHLGHHLEQLTMYALPQHLLSAHSDDDEGSNSDEQQALDQNDFVLDNITSFDDRMKAVFSDRLEVYSEYRTAMDDMSSGTQNTLACVRKIRILLQGEGDLVDQFMASMPEDRREQYAMALSEEANDNITSLDAHPQTVELHDEVVGHDTSGRVGKYFGGEEVYSAATQNHNPQQENVDALPKGVALGEVMQTTLDSPTSADSAGEEDRLTDEAHSPRISHMFKRGDPPTNGNDMFFCEFDPNCKGLEFDSTHEWSKHMDKHDRPYRCLHSACAKLQGFTSLGRLLRHERQSHDKHGGTHSESAGDSQAAKRGSVLEADDDGEDASESIEDQDGDDTSDQDARPVFEAARKQGQIAVDTTGQVAPYGLKPKLATTWWEDEMTLCYFVEANGVFVGRREDNHMINGTKLLNVAGMTRDRRDGILKSERTRHVIKVGSMKLKGVWIPFGRALELANHERITPALFPLFYHDIGALLQINQSDQRTIDHSDHGAQALHESSTSDRGHTLPADIEFPAFMIDAPGDVGLENSAVQRLWMEQQRQQNQQHHQERRRETYAENEPELAMTVPPSEQREGRSDASETHPDVTFDARIDRFISSLYNVIEDMDTHHLISWTDRGDSFVMSSSLEFSQKVLAHHFTMKNLASFLRWIDSYGFDKVEDIFSPATPDSPLWEFKHCTGFFTRGDVDGLRKIRRIRRRNLEDFDWHRDFFPEKAPKHPLSPPLNPAFDADKEKSAAGPSPRHEVAKRQNEERTSGEAAHTDMGDFLLSDEMQRTLKKANNHLRLSLYSPTDLIVRKQEADRIYGLIQREIMLPAEVLDTGGSANTRLERRKLIQRASRVLQDLQAISGKDGIAGPYIERITAEAETLQVKESDETERLVTRDAPDSSKAPIRLVDAVGRKFSFPWHLCKAWRGMEQLIKQAFLYVDGLGEQVAAGHYDLTGPNGEIMYPERWEATVQPGSEIHMHMWPAQEPEDGGMKIEQGMSLSEVDRHAKTLESEDRNAEKRTDPRKSESEASSTARTLRGPGGDEIRQKQIRVIEKSVRNLLVATKQLLETLTQWSQLSATDKDVSDVYVRMGDEFNISCRAFKAMGVDTADLGPVPDRLRHVLENALSLEASQESLDRYLPRIRDIIINLLHGLKKKQQNLRGGKSSEGTEDEARSTP